MMHRNGVVALLWATLALVAGCSDDDHHGPVATLTPTAVALHTATATTGTATATAAAAHTATATAALTATATQQAMTSFTATSTVAPAASSTATPVATASVTPTFTPNVPEITYFGIARADDLPLMPDAIDGQGRPVFERIQGQAMMLVVEARHGSQPLETSAYDPGGRRGVDFLVSRPLGNGSPVVCDVAPPEIGGVPGIDPPLFSDDRDVQDAIDDLGCRVNDGTGAPLARFGESACTRMEPSFDYGFVDEDSDLQFCLPIARLWNFPVGDTIVVARVRDTAGIVSAVREIVVRVQAEQPFVCDQGLGERTFAIRRPPSRLLNAASGTADASVDPWQTASLRICAGRELTDGLYPLNVRDDAVVGVPLADGTVLCAKITARGSSGTLDCNGGSAFDVEASQDREALTRITVETGLGLDAGTGAALIRLPIAFVQLPDGSAEDCQDAVYPPSFNAALTTAAGVAQVRDLDSSVLAESSAVGVPFACESWRAGGAGAFVLPLPIVNGPAGDLATVLVLSE